MAVINNATGIQIKRYNGTWNNLLFPKTAVSLLVKSVTDDTPFLDSGGKIQTTFLPDYLLGQIVYAGVVVTDTENTGGNNPNYLADNYAANMFKKIIVNLTDAGKTKIIANNSGSTITWNSTYPNKAILYYSSVQGVDPDPQNTFPYPAFDFRECTDCYFIFKHPEHGHVAGNGYELFVDVATNNATNLLSDVIDGDWIISSAEAWEKIDNTDAVTSVAGKKGAVTLGISDIVNLSSTLDSKAPKSQASFTDGVTIAGGLTLTNFSAGFIKSSSSGVLSVDENSYATTANAIKDVTANATNKTLTFTGADSQTKRVLTFAEGSSNGTIKITSNQSGTPAIEVAVHGLGSAAYTDSTAYAAAIHSHNPADINGPTEDTDYDTGFLMFSLGGGSSTNTPLWKTFESLPTVSSNYNGLMTTTDYHTLINLRSNTTTGLTGHTGDICFETIA